MAAMKARIIRIGNSQGIRLPKPLLEQSHLGEEVLLEAHEGQIVIKALPEARAGWAEQFKAMAEHGDDQLLDAEAVTTTWDEEEWEW
jgi:antitoxin MazE